MFTTDWHEAFVPQSGTAWMSLMKATEDDLARIHNSALAACRDLPASTVVRSHDQLTIGDILARFQPNQPHQDRTNGILTAPAGATDRQAEQWLAAGESRYADLVRHHFGSPETIAAGGHLCLQAGDTAAALFFFQKSIDLLHTLYVVSGMQRRSPSPADQPIITSYVDTLDEVLGLYPQAPIAASVREVTHRLRTISTLCRDAAVDPSPYLSALNQLSSVAPDVDVSDILWRY